MLHVRTPSFPTRRSSDLFVLIFPPQGFIIPVRDLRQRVIRHLVEQRGSHLGRTPWLARQLERTRLQAFPGEGLGSLLADRIGNNSGSRYYRSEEHTSELQSLMRNSYAVFCLKKNND